MNDFLPGSKKKSKLIESKKEEMSSDPIHILPELKEWIRPLTESERFNLKKSIEDEGVRDPITVFHNESGQKVLLDGHNRYAIVQELGGEDNGYELQEAVVEIDSLEDAKLWMIKNQVGKRNLSKREMSFYRGNHYLTNKSGQGQSTGAGKLHELLADEYGVSPKSIQNDAMIATILNCCSADFRYAYFDGEIKVTLEQFKAVKSKLSNGELDDEASIEAFLKGEAIAIKRDSRPAVNPQKKYSFNKFVKTLNTLVDAELTDEISEAEKLSMEGHIKSLVKKYNLDV
ncbi:ParB N-terminal domain-containing protein (plasmid) [Flammeovirga sp. MY04]|uniref:ParB N-terminal domain-containing protein n=1 Tax=Flammeovirga sp. MY04 TaxID=1191459 RepID=UPI0013052937|nr:ParB N-terminal domain-containing protein [Flammeovirga sp. MY04]ANQ52912.2 ParB N-terminal domain-containing protein [Flammeovirga sp. MY04]